MEQIKKFLGDKRVKMFFWNSLGAFLSILAIYLGDLDPKFSVILVPVILAITKYINKKYL
jgi:hypothetical protein